MRVLHVTEAMGGGVITSVLAMVEATPGLDHHLVARSRPGHDTGDDWTRAFSTVDTLPGDPVRAVLRLRRAVRDLFPDVVHVHSSVAGAIVRAAGAGGAPVAYSPHCFAFERRDIGVLQRRAYRYVERVLAPRTDLLVAVAPREVDLGVELGHREIAYVANRTFDLPARRARFAAPLRIATVGRVSAQKDWRYLLHVKRYAETQLGVDASWEWLGGGDAQGEDALREAGVSVSGWLEREEIVDRLAGAQVYLHSAAWEAAPIALLEAAELGLPLAIRAIPALQSLDLPGATASVVRLAERIRDLQRPDAWARAQYESDAVARRHTRGVQAGQLVEAYARICAGLAVLPTPADEPELAPARAVVDLAARPLREPAPIRRAEPAVVTVRERGR